MWLEQSPMRPVWLTGRMDSSMATSMLPIHQTFDSISSAMTVSGWVCFNALPSSNGAEQPLARKDNHLAMEVSVDGSTLEMRTALATSSPSGWTGNNDDVFNPALVAGQWYYLAFAYNGAAGQLWNFENGVTIGGSPHNISGSISANGNFLGLGGIYGCSLQNAILDEIRVEPVFRSTNWIWASYLTVASNTVSAAMVASRRAADRDQLHD